MADPSLVADCSAQQYCTRPGQALSYGNQFVVHWNNQLPPLNPQSLVTISVYSSYDLNHALFQQTNVANTNGQATLAPSALWYSRYTGDDDSVGRNQTIYFAVFLQGNDVPPVSAMLPLQLTATNAQYQAIQAILHPPTSTTTLASTTASSSTALSSTSTSTSSLLSTTTSLSTAPPLLTLQPSSTSTPATTHARSDSGLSAGAIAGISVGSLTALLLLLFLFLFAMRRHRRRRHLHAKKAASPEDELLPPTALVVDSGLGSNTGEKQTPAIAPPRTLEKSPSDTPLLLSGRPNNSSFASHEGSLIDSQQLSPMAYQPLSLESPRVLMNMPRSTRVPDAILSSDDARQIGDIFRDALRKPPPSEDELDDQLEDDNDPGWRERVASERMQRELREEASVIRSVAMRAHGSSDHSAISRPDTPLTTKENTTAS